MAPNEQPGVGPGATDPSASVTAFVLGGGGKWGAVQVGMLAALVRADVQPDLVLGCSIGAINGAAFAAQPDADGVARRAGSAFCSSSGSPKNSNTRSEAAAILCSMLLTWASCWMGWVKLRTYWMNAWMSPMVMMPRAAKMLPETATAT